MTETNYIDTEDAWDARQLPFTEEAAPIISAWTSDEEIAAQAAEFSAIYGNEYELDTSLRLFRAELRAAALATTASPLMTEAVAVVDNLNHLVTADTTDAELRTLTDAAEAGGPIPELLEELTRLRDSERDERVFVAGTGAGAPRVGSLHEQV